MIRSITIIFIFLTLINAESSHSSTNIVLNSGFEVDVDNNNSPDSWKTSKSRGVKIFFEYGKGHTGLRSAKLTCKDINSTDNLSSHAMLYQINTIELIKGKFYKFSFWAKHSGLKTRALSVGLKDLKNRRSCDLYTMFSLSVEKNKWKKYTYYFRASRNCTKKNRLQFWFKEKGVVWIDDVEFASIEKSTFTPENIVKKGRNKNLLSNSGFESGTDGWGSFTLSRLPWGGLSRLVGEVDSSQAFEGRASMKVALSPKTFPVYHLDYFKIINKKIKDPLLGNVGWIKVRKGKEHVLSMYLKSQKTGTPVRLGVYEFMMSPKTEIINVSNKWKRYSIKVTPRSDYCFVLVGPDLNNTKLSSATLWIDEMQFEEGKVPTSYEPSDDVEIGLFTEKSGNIFTQGEQVQVFTTIKNSARYPKNIAYDIEIFDFYDKLTKKMSFFRVIEKRSSLKEKINLNIKTLGFFKVKVTMRWDEYKVTKKLRMALIPKYSSEDSVFGINHAYGWDYLLNNCKKAGITWVRDWSLKWNEVEPIKGKFDFSKTDVEIDRIKKQKLNILGLLPFPSNEWSSSAKIKDNDSVNISEIKKIISFAPRNEEEFKTYIKETVKHNKKKIHHWQIFNEPITTRYSLPARYGYSAAEYFYWIKEAYKSAKEIDPDCKILIGLNGYVRDRLNVFEALFRMGVMKYCDIITVHVYPRIIPPESFEAPIKSLRLLMEKYRDIKPIWITEHGYYSEDEPETKPDLYRKYLEPLNNESLQASYAIRFATIQMANGIKKIIFHAGVSTKLNHETTQGIFFKYNGVPRKIYPAVAAFTNMISPETQFVKKLNLGADIWAYFFKKDYQSIIVIWKPTGGNVSKLILKNEKLKANDIMLNPISKREIELTSFPIYITASNLTADQFENGIEIHF